MNETQNCSGCAKPVTRFDRYPKYLCFDCVAELTDEDGLGINYHNSSLGYLYGTYKEDAAKRYPNNRCFYKGIEYRAREGRFGGVVVQPAVEGEAIEKTLVPKVAHIV
ncbi:hypothetical protein [Shewanella donghaensis]|uniref:hypothetical protein n=1 Tax=Shewanella donghaensis TaxID=238836 RepID=UPI00118229B6|nr:hypothetical protein [Shewanella donghaensis]